MDVPHFPKMNIFCIDLPADNFVIIVSYRIRVYHHAPSLSIRLHQLPQPVIYAHPLVRRGEGGGMSYYSHGLIEPLVKPGFEFTHWRWFVVPVDVI
jgi:hypothetical protein